MSGGYGYGKDEPVEKCPYCATECRAEFTDVGVGYVQTGPYACENCHAVEIGPHDTPRELTADEQRSGWYAPGRD